VRICRVTTTNSMLQLFVVYRSGLA
jgi:hypothetical protein